MNTRALTGTIIKDEALQEMLESYNLEITDFTCLNCGVKTVCEYSFDPYNIHGDCLALK